MTTLLAARLRQAARDARVPLLACLAYVVLVVAVPLGNWWALVTLAWGLALAIGYAGVDPGRLLNRGLLLWLTALFFAAIVAHSHPARGALGIWVVFGSLAFKSALAIGAVLTLSLRQSTERVVGALAGLGLPAVFTSTLYFMTRYVRVLADERDRMDRARRARSFNRQVRPWRTSARLIAALLGRTFERGERVFRAMLARGWDGNLRRLDDPRGPRP